MLSPCSHDGGSPVIWKFRWVAVEPIDNISSCPWFMLNIQLVLETSISIIFVSRSWSICLDERSDFLQFLCNWCKLPPWIWEDLFYLLWNHSESAMHVQSILWSVRLIIFIPYEFCSTLSHWLTCSRKRSCCAILGHAQDSVVLVDGSQPELGSVLLWDYYVVMLVWDSVFTCM